MSLTPLIAVHATAAIAATALGPFALWARLGRRQHPRLHRAFGYAWVTLMVVTAVSGHRKTMQGLYVGACLVAGGFALAPGRLLGQWVCGQWLGLMPEPRRPGHPQPRMNSP